MGTIPQASWVYWHAYGGYSMKQQNFSARQAVRQGERMILVLQEMLAKRGKTSVVDVQGMMGMTTRTVQRYLDQLVQAGYVLRDDATPAGFIPSEKAKQLFEVKG